MQALFTFCLTFLLIHSVKGEESTQNYITAGQLYDSCTDVKPIKKIPCQLYLHAYVMGFNDGASYGNFCSVLNKRTVKTKLSVEQLSHMLVRHIDENHGSKQERVSLVVDNIMTKNTFCINKRIQ